MKKYHFKETSLRKIKLFVSVSSLVKFLRAQRRDAKCQSVLLNKKPV